jgi:RNA polymerase sigma-70 factor (ECF subfamily)
VADSDAKRQTELLVAVRDSRDRTAFSQLFDHFAPRLKAMLVRSNMNQAQADDILQDVMLTIWRKAHLFDPARAGASAWIYRVARNRMIDIVRKERRAIPPELYDDAVEPEKQSADLGQAQEAQLLRAALERLPENQRAMIERAYLGELTHQEINRDTGLPVGTIKSRIRLGLEKLRHDLKDLRKP